MELIGTLATSKTINGKELYINVLQYKSVYRVFALWEDETDYCIKGVRVKRNNAKDIRDAAEMAVSCYLRIKAELNK